MPRLGWAPWGWPGGMGMRRCANLKPALPSPKLWESGQVCATHTARWQNASWWQGTPTRRAHLDPLLDCTGQQGSGVTPLLPLQAWATLDLGNEARAAAVIVQCLAQA